MNEWGDEFDHQRRFTRREVHLNARLRCGGHELRATTENISPGGAFFCGEVPAETDDLIASIELPEGRGLHVRARVRWRRQSPAGVGVEFATFLPSPWE